MIGQKIASLEAFPRSGIQRLWGIPDIHTRQKWIALNPYLASLPDHLRLLDAGCGNGTWSLELAARHPSWTIMGIDKNSEAIQQAEYKRQVLGLQNVAFVEADFLNFQPVELFNAVLSIASAHYLVEQNQGKALFDEFHAWLRPGGRLILLGPRMRDEVPLLEWLPQPISCQRTLYSHAQLIALCQQSGLRVDDLVPAVFQLGTMAKQLCVFQDISPRFLGKLLYPLEWSLSVMDIMFKFPSDCSYLWVMSAVRE